jgi:UDP-glucose 4-epimerase
MTVLLTGSGLVGCQAASWLLNRGEEVIFYDAAPRPEYIGQLVDLKKLRIIKGDLLDFPKLTQTIKENSVRKVVHTAGMLVRPTAENPHWGVMVNIQGTMNILESARIFDVERVVFASSGMVYSTEDSGVEPIREDHPLKPISVYATCKLAGEHLGRNYHELYGVEYAASRFGIIFGPWGGPPSGAAEMIIQPFLQKVVAGEDAVLNPEFMKTQLPPRLVYSRDAGWSLAELCLRPKLQYNFFNISMEHVPSWSEMVKMVRSIVPDARIAFDEERLRSIPPSREQRPLDIGLAKQELGFNPTTMREALGDFIRWIRNTIHLK